MILPQEQKYNKNYNTKVLGVIFIRMEDNFGNGLKNVISYALEEWLIKWMFGLVLVVLMFIFIVELPTSNNE